MLWTKKLFKVIQLPLAYLPFGFLVVLLFHDLEKDTSLCCAKLQIASKETSHEFTTFSRVVIRTYLKY